MLLERLSRGLEVVCRMGLSDHDPRPLSFQELGGGGESGLGSCLKAL